MIFSPSLLELREAQAPPSLPCPRACPPPPPLARSPPSSKDFYDLVTQLELFSMHKQLKCEVGPRKPVRHTVRPGGPAYTARSACSICAPAPGARPAPPLSTRAAARRPSPGTGRAGPRPDRRRLHLALHCCTVRKPFRYSLVALPLCSVQPCL